MPPDVDITLIILVAMVVGVPILGVTARLAIRPIVEAILLLHESYAALNPSKDVELRVSRLEEEVRLLSGPPTPSSSTHRRIGG